MDPITMSLIGTGIGAVGGLLGQLLSGKSREEADAILSQMRDQYGKIDPAKVKQIAVEQLGPSALEGLNNGQEMGAMQDSLNRLGSGIEHGGMTLQDRAAENEALDAAGQQDRAQRAAVTRQYAGTGSQGLLAGLMAQQSGAQNANRVGMSSAANAQQRYWNMIRDRAGVAQTMYGDKARAADAKDAIARWNATNTQQTGMYNNSLEQQRFDNDLRKTNGQTSIAEQQAGIKRGDADRTAAIGAGVGDAVNQGIGTYANYTDRQQQKPASPGPWKWNYGY